MPLPENERRVLAAVAQVIEAGDSARLPLGVQGLSEPEVLAAARRLDLCDPPVWDAVSVADLDHPALVSELTERGLREVGVWPASEIPAAAARAGAGPFTAQVVRVFIASPSDVPEERDLIERVVHRWNADNAETTSTVLLPVRWETHATAEVGGSPQEIVNRQIVDGSDMLLGVFWTRLGTPTRTAASGTAEEIDRFLEAGKPVSLFFSARPVQPGSIDQEQWAALQEFKRRLESTALLSTYQDLGELERLVSSAIVRTVRERFAVAADLGAARVPASPQAALRAYVERGYSSRGSQTWHLVLENVGRGTAESVQASLFPTGTETRAWEAINLDVPLEFLASGTEARFPLLMSMASPSRSNIMIRWRNEDGSDGTQQQTLTM